jgi:hypothetical protein
MAFLDTLKAGWRTALASLSPLGKRKSSAEAGEPSSVQAADSRKRVKASGSVPEAPARIAPMRPPPAASTIAPLRPDLGDVRLDLPTGALSGLAAAGSQQPGFRPHGTAPAGLQATPLSEVRPHAFHARVAASGTHSPSTATSASAGLHPTTTLLQHQAWCRRAWSSALAEPLQDGVAHIQRVGGVPAPLSQGVRVPARPAGGGRYFTATHNAFRSGLGSSPGLGLALPGVMGRTPTPGGRVELTPRGGPVREVGGGAPTRPAVV